MSQSLSGQKILMVEDNYLLLDEFRDILEEEGADVTTAQSVREGLKQIGGDFDTVLLDIRLPDGEVYPIADHFRDSSTRIVFLSGFDDLNVALVRYPNAKALSKPITADDLVSAVGPQ